jgi:hypothetical protein
MKIKRSLVTFYRRFRKAAAQLKGNHFPLSAMDAVLLQKSIGKNRAALKLIDDWLPPQLIEQSVFRYGINSDVEPLLNLTLDPGCTHADLLAYYGATLNGPCKYLEIGVSVGKTLWQILHACAPCECWGFDIEEINPVLKRHFVEVSRMEWQGPPDSIKKTPSSISRFTHPSSGGSIVYICADVFDKRAWELLAGNHFNLVLSDALHTPEALDFEWRQMTVVGIFDPDEIVIMWDDLDGKMRDWFYTRRNTIARQLAVEIKNVDTGFVNGWLGQREFPHRLGLAIKKPLRIK